MLRELARVNRNETLPRMLVDICVVQAAGIAALFSTALWWAPQLGWQRTLNLILLLEDYYTARFLPLSLVFPLVFLGNGFYNQSRGYVGRYKWLVVLRGCLTATLLFLFLNFLFSRETIMPRSSILAFGLMVTAGVIGVRWLKAWLLMSATVTPVRQVAENRSSPVLVVGGAGYIGSILCRQLLAAGEKVRVLDSLIYGDSPIRDLLGRPGFELIVGDCRNIQSVVSAMRSVKSVVHLAAIVGDPACEQDRQAALETNYAATRMLIEIAKGNRVERFLFASSCSVYGATNLLMDENSAVQPISLYGHTKIDSERALIEARTVDFHPIILRLATVFGLGHRPRFDLVVNLLAAKAYYERLITIYNGQQWRPFIHVRDVADGIMLALRAELQVVSGEIFNLGDSRMNYRLSDLGEMIRKTFPDTRIEHVDNADARNYRVSFGKVRNLLGFRCTRTLADGIQELKCSFEQKAITDYTDARYNNQKFLETFEVASIDRVQSRVMAAFSGASEPLSPSAPV